jgi:hypothetical protein
MKKRFLLLPILFCFFISKANKIDDLRTDEDVMAFIKPILKEKFKIDELDLSFSAQENMACKNLSSNQNLRKWSKADFNNDGQTDLFLNIYQPAERPMILVVIAICSDNYRIINLNQLRSACEFGYTERRGEIASIILKRTALTKQKKDSSITDTLQYLNLIDNFINIKKSHPKYSIENIEFSTDHCFGVCPVFSFTIDSKGAADYEAIEFNAQQGKFKANLSSAIKDSLFQLLNDIDFPNLKDNYAVSWTDQQTAILKITYNNGEIKTINDYGMKESFSLAGLYSFLLNLRNTEQWKKQ